MEPLETLRQLLRQQEIFEVTESPSDQGEAAAVGAGKSSSSTVGIRSADSAAGTSVAPSKAAKKPRLAWANRIMSLADRTTQLEDHLTEMVVVGHNLKNEILTQLDENLLLQLALSDERWKFRRDWTQEGGSSSPVVSPLTAPRRHLQLPLRYMDEWDPARSSPLILPSNIHTTNDVHGNDDDDANSLESLVRRFKALSSRLPMTGPEDSINSSAGHFFPDF